MPDVAELSKQNDEREANLMREGVIVSPMIRMAAQVEILAKHFAWREWEEERQLILDQAESEVQRAKLTAGLNQGVQMSLADVGGKG